MTPEQRSHIRNGIWLCAACGTLVDRDEVRYTAAELHQIKRDHEVSRRLGPGGVPATDDLIAIGPSLIALGSLVRVTADAVRARISHFVNGSSRDLWSLSEDFARWPVHRRYVLFNELGYGAMLAAPPVVERSDRWFDVEFRVEERAARHDATKPIATMDRNTGRLLRGLDAYRQTFTGILSLGTGTWFTDLDTGSSLSDLYWRYEGSPWFERLAKIEMIRLSSISRRTLGQVEPVTAFRIVNRVNDVVVPTFTLDDSMLALEVEFDLEPSGPWRDTLSVFISTPEQLADSRANAQHRHAMIRAIEADNR